jgi:hypothetical protein
MPPRYVAAVNCPSCGTRFQTPVEQILDVRVDPSARNRALSGTVNVAVCPACGTRGALNIPFVYHDPENEVALLYLPVDAGPNEVERQKAAGQLTRQLMDNMPPEERKGYLLQPETFISMESFVKRVLELEGISEEDMERSQRQRALMENLVNVSEEEWPEILEENESLVDEGFFALLEYIMQLGAAMGQEAEGAEKVDALHDYLVEETELGQALSQRSEVVRGFAEDPTRESLLNALIQAPDEDTVLVLVQSGLPLMDYSFFQALNKRIEEAETTEDEQALRALRRRILDTRNELVEQSESLAQERRLLLSKLLATEDPVKMAASHLSELDDLFFVVMASEMEAAQEQGDQTAVAELRKVATAVNRVMERNMPPEIALTRRLLTATSDEQLERQLREYEEMITPQFIQFLDGLQASMSEQGQDEAVDRLVEIQAKARKYVSAAAPEAPAPQPKPQAQADSDSEERTPSGLIIAKH